ncbi:MAG: methionine synthase [Sulfolobales archaeon]|nr:methionine synthase [Sulfolobales archaeon]MDW8082399.1 methionine synthase [Sulfolobales archaeon]
MRSYEVPRKFPTTVVGSYPKIAQADRAIKLRKSGQISELEFRELVKPAIREVVEDHLWAGIDIVSDGEQARDDMVVYFAERLRGYSSGGWVRVFDNEYFKKPIVLGKIEWIEPMAVDLWSYASSVSSGRPVKVTLTGPYTMLEWSFDLHYRDRKELMMDLARAIRKEVEKLVAAGAKYVQIDEPALSTKPFKEEADMLKEALDVVFRGIEAKRIIHICYGRIEKILPYILEYPVDQFDLEMKNSNFRLLPYLKEYGYNKEIGCGVVDVHSFQVESVREIKESVEKLMREGFIGPEKVYLDPDCGLKRLPREIARAKLKNIAEAARQLREEW